MRWLILLVLVVACKPPAPAAPLCVAGGFVRDVSFPASDGWTIHGELASPCAGPRPVVVLVHQACRDRSEWSGWIAELHARGLATLAIDLRGHGASTLGPDGAEHDLCRDLHDPLAASFPLDVAAAVASVEGPVAIVGSAEGADAALAVTDPRVRAVVAISPSVTESHGRVFAVAAADDRRAADAVRAMQAARNTRLDAEILPEGEHGNRMFEGHPERLRELVAKLARALGRTD